MPSSIFSSSRDRWGDVWHLLFAVWVLLALVGFAAVLPPAGAQDADIVAHEEPDAWGSFYLAHDRGGHIDHHVLYHGIDAASLTRLRAADVLFLGNSRLMFALESRILRPLLAPDAVDYYVLGFGHEEQDDFPLAIIEEYDLRPEVVVINADRFFATGTSDWAERVLRESDFDAWKVQVEGEAAHAVRRRLHQVVPHYVDLRRGEREVVLYRSRDDGTWFIANDFGEGAAFDWPLGDREEPSREAMEQATVFKHALQQRGARLVLCLVPGPNVSLHRAQALAAHLGVPLIVPRVEDLRTIDGSHLSYDSAARVTASLIDELRTLLP
jgi:hypothetical protein